jgi:hypothetical protein
VCVCVRGGGGGGDIRKYARAHWATDRHTHTERHTRALCMGESGGHPRTHIQAHLHTHTHTHTLSLSLSITHTQRACLGRLGGQSQGSRVSSASTAAAAWSASPRGNSSLARGEWPSPSASVCVAAAAAVVGARA